MSGFFASKNDSKCLLSLQRGRLLSQNKLKKFEKTLDRPVAVCYNGRKAPRRPRFRTSLLHFGAERLHFCTSFWHFGAGRVRLATSVPFSQKRQKFLSIKKGTIVPLSNYLESRLSKLDGILTNSLSDFFQSL